jgi:phage tail-like protein
MAARSTPYGAFNFIINIDGQEAFGGFSDVSGLSTDITVAEYRNGNERENHVRKVPGMHKVSDVTLKRGIVNSTDLWTWVNEVRRNGSSAKRTVVVTMLDEARSPVMAWTLSRVFPMKYSGPTLAAKGGGDVAMEELVLSVEGLEFEQVA